MPRWPGMIRPSSQPDDEAMAWLLNYMQRLWRDGPPKLTPAMVEDAAIGDLFEEVA